ncbi:SGNH/GDSL hydrolase family protein [Schlesneria sp.]|uniref:SGNH/GDSL hydrolase family protein n=1 Tax=Schlesneria sp. TaxID=2762018 RepID=UPI002F0B7D86
MKSLQLVALLLTFLYLGISGASPSPVRTEQEEGTVVVEKTTMGSLDVSKVLFLGNSITLHSPAPAIGWTGNWGMAASAQELDYVHLLSAQIAEAASMPKTKVRNIADFERGYNDYDIEGKLKAELDFAPQVVIVAIGENVSELATPEAEKQFAAAFDRLLASLKARQPQAIFVRSSFWPNATKDQIMKQACASVDATYVDIHRLAEDESNFARSERVIEHAGVAGHPGDKGMRAIADAIFAAIQQRSKQQPEEKRP